MKLLDTIIDSTGEELDVYFSDKLKNTPAMIELLKANVEVIESGLTGLPHLLIHETDRVLWVQTKNKKIKCCVAFRPNLDQGTMTLALSYTEPGSRGKGIRPLLQPYFDKASLDEGLDIIVSLIHADNISSQVVALKQGYKPLLTYYFRKIPK
jgi:hypothetical protein